MKNKKTDWEKSVERREGIIDLFAWLINENFF